MSLLPTFRPTGTKFLLLLLPLLLDTVSAAKLRAQRDVQEPAAPQGPPQWATQQLAAGLPCSPGPDEIWQLLGGAPPVPIGSDALAPPPDFKFFLHEEGAFNMSRTVSCFFNHLGGEVGVDDLDVRALPDVSEHLTDYWILKQLRNHPSRTMNEMEADVQIIGAPLYLAYVAVKKAGCGDFGAHQLMLERVAGAMRTSPSWQRSNGTDFLFINTPPTNTLLPGKVLNDELRNMLFPNAIFATADKEYWGVAGYDKQIFKKFLRGGLIMPYKAHFKLDGPERPVTPAVRELSLMFHGDMSRGTGMRSNIPNITRGLPDASVMEHGSNSKGRRREAQDIDSFRNISLESAATYVRSDLCLVPAGDSPTSRRLFDALASGCVPVVFSDFEKMAENLPFKHSVDWPNIAIFAGSLSCAAEDIGSSNAWLHGLVQKRGSEALLATRQRGQAAFKYLSYHSPGIVTALLRELQPILAQRRQEASESQI